MTAYTAARQNMVESQVRPNRVTDPRVVGAMLELPRERFFPEEKASLAYLDDVIVTITKHLKKGERIRIVGLGILQVRKRAARTGRNPATGETIQIKASKKVAFRAAKEVKEAI